MAPYVLAIDQGTTSTRAILFRTDTSIAAMVQQEFEQHFPASGWVEHEPADLWATTLSTCRTALEKARATAKDVAAIGITNQRETTLVWDRANGEPLGRAIVWQGRRTAELCAAQKAEGAEPMIAARTGLLVDPHFSATKISWDAGGASLPEIFGAPIAIRGVAGDQQAASVGQACFVPGMMKSTYGPGCFAPLKTR